MSKNNKSKSRNSRVYALAALLVFIMAIVDVLLVRAIANGNTEISRKTSGSMNSINRMNSELGEIDANVLSIIAGVGNATAQANAAAQHFENIEDAIKDFEAIEGMSDEAARRFQHAKVVINTYRERLTQFSEQWNVAAGGGFVLGSSAFGGDLASLYTQDIYSLQVTASEMLRATIEIVNNDTAEKMAANAKRTILLIGFMILVAIISELAIFIFSRRAKRANLELEEREKNLREVDAKLKSTRQKANDLAVINILTGMKNRYALDNDITDRLESDRFNIAVFDLDNFRTINDTYGYDFGDEYLIAVADRLKSEFGDKAEIYNITGNEFCFVFNKEISESIAMGIVQNIHAVMTSPYEVLNLTVQLTASGSVYHYMPGDCLNVNSLLVKLDTAMRNAKLNGGNMINTVVDIA